MPDLFTETQRRTRGHVFAPPAVVRRRTPAIGTSTGPLADRLVLAHYFTGAWDWFVIEAEWTTGLAFGYVTCNGEGEWGYFDLTELEAITPRSSYRETGATSGVVGVGQIRWVVERDCWWTVQAAGQVDKIAAAA